MTLADTKFLWLVVTGAPTEHWTHVSRRRGGPGGRARASTNTTSTNDIAVTNVVAVVNASINTTAQWPYTFKLTGTKPVDPIIH